MTRAEYRKSRGNFIFHNENPKGLLSSSDCVIRAISKATGKSWDDVFIGLNEVGFKLKNIANTKKVYDQYLKELGYEMQKQPRKMDNTRLTVQEFIDITPDGTYILSLRGHLTVVVDGYLYDTWNCLSDVLGNYWEVV